MRQFVNLRVLLHQIYFWTPPVILSPWPIQCSLSTAAYSHIFLLPNQTTKPLLITSLPSLLCKASCCWDHLYVVPVGLQHAQYGGVPTAPSFWAVQWDRVVNIHLEMLQDKYKSLWIQRISEDTTQVCLLSTVTFWWHGRVASGGISCPFHHNWLPLLC